LLKDTGLPAPINAALAMRLHRLRIDSVLLKDTGLPAPITLRLQCVFTGCG